MKQTLKTSFVVSCGGIGVIVGALAPVMPVHTVVLIAVGLGLAVGGIFRALNGLAQKSTGRENVA